MTKITTHILDVSLGRPAAGVQVRLERRTNDSAWERVGTQQTDDDGRARELVPDGESVAAGVHRLTFAVGPYFKDKQVEGFYEDIVVTFVVRDESQHYHVPLLLSPYGYSTYRGS